MKLSAVSKKKLLDSAKKVYLSYTALDFFKTQTFPTDTGVVSLYEICEKTLAENKTETIFHFNNQSYKLSLTPGENNSYKVQLTAPEPKESVVKQPVNYKVGEVLDLLSNQELIIEKGPESQLIVSNTIDKNCVIGGAGKMDLYRTHLVTLYNIIEKIQSEQDISSLLVALATGSGKTFVQALWLLILSLADLNGIFAIPGNLLVQFTKDLKRLLPDTIVNKALILNANEPESQAMQALASMEHATGPKHVIIGSTEHLLDAHYSELLKAEANHSFLIFDEQHLIMKNERRRVRLNELTKTKISMFLTATPNQETYQLSGNKPVAIMSSGQKQQAGQGQFPRLLTHQARSVSDKHQYQDYKFWTGSFWNTALNGLLLSLTNSIQEEHSSAASSLVKDLPFYYYRKENEKDIRWRFQVPAARKMLCIIDNNEDLDNFFYSLDHYSHNVYKNGNVIDRAEIARFFGIPDAEIDILRQAEYKKETDYLASLEGQEREIGQRLASKSLGDHLTSTIFHNLIEYVLTDITGLDEIEHNRLRKKDMKAFTRMVLDKWEVRSQDHYFKKLEKELDAKGAETLSKLLSGVSTHMQSLKVSKDRLPNGFEQATLFDNFKNAKFEDFVDNWSLNDDLLNSVHNSDLYTQFNLYAQTHKVMGVMTGMQDAETPIQESKPFAGLSCDRYMLYDSDGIKVNKAKKRKLTSLEILNDASFETRFTPNHLDITEAQADNYVKLGFVGAYVSNKKTEGFSDRNLHTVINIAEKKLSPTNSPDTQIQGIGRNRGLDDTIEPAYIHSLGRKEKNAFDLNHLKSEDYYPELFKSQEQFNKEYVKVIGDDVSEKIIHWIHANQEADQSINPDKLKRQVLKFIAQALREINSKNRHEITISRDQLSKVISYAMDGIQNEIASIKKPYSITPFISGLGRFLNFICECYYTIKRIIASWQMFQFFRKGTKTAESNNISKTDPDDLYKKILSKTSFKGIIKKMSSALEFKNWLNREGKGVEPYLKKHFETFLKDDLKTEFEGLQNKLLIPLLVKMVKDDKKEKVNAALNAYPHLVPLLKANQSMFENLLTIKSSSLLVLLHEIPGLEDLGIQDMTNYPQQFEELEGILVQSPESMIFKDEQAKNELNAVLELYLKGDFIKRLSPLFTYPKIKALSEILNKENNAQQFVNHCMTKMMNKEMDLSLSLDPLVNELKRFFMLEDLNTLDKEVNLLGVEFVNVFKEEIQYKSVEILQKWIPIWVNTYPLESRERLFKEALNPTKIEAFIVAHGQELEALKTSDPTKIPAFALSKLCTNPLPAAMPIPDDIDEQLQIFVAGKFKEIYDKTGFWNIVGGKLSTNGALFSLYAYDVPFANLLKTDDFLEKISIVLPYDQWLDLKTKIKNDPNLLGLARKIIDEKYAGKEIALPEILNLVNMHYNDHGITYQSTDTAIAEITTATAKLTDPATFQTSENPLELLDVKTQVKISKLIKERLIPILASFIPEEAKKEEFFAKTLESKDLGTFLSKNIKVLEDLSNEAERKNIALSLINQLVPEDSQLSLKDVADPVEQAEQSLKLLSQEVPKVLFRSFVTSAPFHNVLKMMLTAEDYDLVRPVLASPAKVNVFVDNVFSKEKPDLDKDKLVEQLKKCDPSLKSINFMHERIKSMSEFVEKLNKPGKALDKGKIATHLGNTFTPILFHNQFITMYDDILGYLDVEDITLMLSATDKPNPREDAKQVLEFIDLIKKQDKEALVTKYFTIPTKNTTDPHAAEEFDMENIPAKKMIETIQKLFEEVLDCQCYYNQQDRKGLMMRGGTTPKLASRLSPELKDIRIGMNYDFFNGFARKIFYIKGINDGLSAAGQINADSNAQLLKTLERVNSHILRPLWWSTNVSQLNHAFIKGCKDAAQQIVGAFYAVVNAVKLMLNRLIGKEYFTISVKHPDSQDYNDTAFEYAAIVNELKPLTPEQVKDNECHADTVVKVEEFVKKRPTRPGFFREIDEDLVADVEKQEELRNASKKNDSDVKSAKHESGLGNHSMFKKDGKKEVPVSKPEIKEENILGRNSMFQKEHRHSDELNPTKMRTKPGNNI